MLKVSRTVASLPKNKYLFFITQSTELRNASYYPQPSLLEAKKVPYIVTL